MSEPIHTNLSHEPPHTNLSNEHAPTRTPAEQTPAPSSAHSRRVFLFNLSLALNAAVGVVLAVPVIGYLLGPAMKRASSTGSWVPLGSVDAFPVGQTRLAEFRSPVASFDDGETANTAAWVRRISDSKFQVFAVNCAHLGCPVRWFAQSQLFLCPCHGGAYYADGSRASGPPERGLFEYRYQLSGNTLLIHAGDMPTLATQARNQTPKPLIQIAPAENAPAPTAASSAPPNAFSSETEAGA